MPIAERDISILIPTYRYRDKVARAVASAVASDAGEIVVTDDRSEDGTMSVLRSFDDPRLKVFENSRNLGLWENHLEALRRSSRPWIKFIQADDYLLPGGLAHYAAAADNGVSIVWGLPTVKHDVTGEVFHFHRLAKPIRVRPQLMLDACVTAGWILGSPSHWMIRSDAIERDPEAWQTMISADLIVGAIAAARGDTILLPAGAIGQSVHDQQDARTQSAFKGFKRMVRSLDFLRCRPERGLTRFADLTAAMNIVTGSRSVARSILKREGPIMDVANLYIRFLSGPSIHGWGRIVAERHMLASARSFRRSTGVDLDTLFAATASVDGGDGLDSQNRIAVKNAEHATIEAPKSTP